MAKGGTLHPPVTATSAIGALGLSLTGQALAVTFTPAADMLTYSTSATASAQTSLTSLGRSLIGGASTGAMQTTLGGTTAGQSFFTLANPSAVTFPRINADNSVTALGASAFLSAIGGGAGTVMSVSGTANEITSSGGTTPVISLPTALTFTGKTVTGGTFASVTMTGPILGTPASGNLANCTFPTLNQNTSGSAASLTTSRNINGIAFNGTANINLVTPTAVKTSNYTAVGGDFVPCDATSAFTVTLPNAPSDGSLVAIKVVIQPGTNAVTINCAGSDVFNKTGGSTSGSVSLLNQALLMQYKASGAIWYVLADDITLSVLDARFAAIAQVHYVGTTSIAANRASASQSLTGITSIDGSAATLTTARAIYGNNFDGSAALAQIIASTFGGTGNGFTKFTGPTTSEKTFTLPNASATILTDNAAVTVAQGGTASTTAAAAVNVLGGATSSGTGGLARIDSPVFTTQITAALIKSGGSTATTVVLADSANNIFRGLNYNSGWVSGIPTTIWQIGKTRLQITGDSGDNIVALGLCSAGTMVGNPGFASMPVPTAQLHICAGSAAASSAPLKLTSGTLLTTAEAGAVEFLTDKWYATITTGAARKELALVDAALTSGRVPFVTTNGRLLDDASWTYSASTGMSTSTSISTPILKNSAVQTVVNGSTSGNATFSQPDQGSSLKVCVAYCAALLGTAAYTFPTAFSFAPTLIGALAGIGVATTTTLTLTGTTSTGFVIVEGY